MEFNEYALLAAFLFPVGALAAINVMLAVTGEAGTLLLPSLRAYPGVDLGSGVARVVEPAAAARVEAANVEEELRQAA